MFQFYKFIDEIKITSSFYNKTSIDKYTDHFYNDYPCSSKKDLLENYQYCINKNIIDCTDNNLIENIMSVNDLSRNHDKQFKFGNQTIYIETTSGTTGKPLPILKTNKTRLIESKYLMDCRKKIDSNACLSNGFLFIHSTDNFLAELDIRNDKDVNKDYDKLLNYFLMKNPVWAFSTVLLAKRFFRYLHENMNLEEFKQKCNLSFFETTSQSFNEVDNQYYSNLINAKLINNYGCREVWNIAYECPYGHLHINNNYLSISIVDEENNIVDQDGVVGKVILTSFINKAFPIVKYLIGDYARIYKEHECKCGNKSPIIILEKGRPFEKIKYTQFYGSDIFKRVLRGMYFHENINTFDDIKIIQKDKIFDVYVKGDLSEKFINEFIHISEFLLNTKMFTFNFHHVYNFDFLNMGNVDKDFLFKCF